MSKADAWKHTISLHWLVATLTLGVSMSAFGFLGLGGDSWKEEVLLHDGSRLVVERSQSYGGRREIGQSPPVRDQEIAFTVPGADKRISFKSEYSDDIGRANLKLLALHILNGTPYIIATPNLCLAYNKWGRPNPPYVIFRHEGGEWKRIELQALPAEFEEINLVIDTKGELKRLLAQPVVSAELVRKLNGKLEQPEYKGILRKAFPGADGNCGEMIPTVEGGWIGVGWFRKQPTRAACVQYCAQEKVVAQHCPCESIFQGK